MEAVTVAVVHQRRTEIFAEVENSEKKISE
jgi:hypothetical protein